MADDCAKCRGVQPYVPPDWEYMYEPKNVKVAPYGDVILSMCRICGAFVSDEEHHYDRHVATSTTLH